MAADPDLQPISVRPFAGLADRHDDTAPVGIGTSNRRLHQRRIADGQPDTAGGLPRGRTSHGDGDELAGTLAVAHHLLGEIDQELVQGMAEIPNGGIRQVRCPPA